MRFVKEFWEKAPALHCGLSILWGAGCVIESSWALLVPLVVLLLGGICRTFLFIALSFAYAFLSYPHLHEEGEGVAHMHIESVKIQPSPFYKSYLYQGTLKQFTTEKGVSCNLPCSIYVSFKGKRPSADRDYKICGKLEKKGEHHFVLKPSKKEKWERIENSWSLAEWRFQAKQSVKRFLEKKINHPKSAFFLTALATGAIEDRTLTLEFGRIGIQHILAISGFHFAFIAAFLRSFLRLFFKPTQVATLLLLLLSGYFFFLGNAPSILRAWIAISLFLIAQLFKLRVSGLNVLGTALIVEIFCDPLLVAHIGFQLSFLATLAILLLYPSIDRLCCCLLPKRKLDLVTSMTTQDQHLYLLGAILRKLLSLNIAVHLATIPVLLFLFQKFPLLSLGYNLFFPLGATLSLFLLCLGFTLSFIPPLGNLIHQTNSTFTSVLLISAEHPPAFLDYSLRISCVPLSLLLLFLSFLFVAGMYYKTQHEERTLWN